MIRSRTLLFEVTFVRAGHGNHCMPGNEKDLDALFVQRLGVEHPLCAGPSQIGSWTRPGVGPRVLQSFRKGFCNGLWPWLVY